MPLIIPNKFATRTGSIQLAEMDDNFQYLASELDRITVGLTVSGTAVTLNGNASVTGNSSLTGTLAVAGTTTLNGGLSVPGTTTLGTLNITGTPTGPTPVSTTNNTQLATTAFVKTVIAASVSSAVPTGVVTMWSGAIGSIPAGWYLCDGTNGTPDLRNRFVVAAGSTYSVGATGGSADATLPSHSHTASSSTSTSISDPGHRHWISAAYYDDGNGSTTGSSNSQMYGLWADAGGYSANDPGSGYGRYSASSGTGITASSSTSTTVNSTGVSATNANLPPYYALAYIMKA